MRRLAGVDTLRERRVQQCDKFANNCVKSRIFSGWFPKKGGRSSARKGETYREDYARTETLKNLPIYYMRRRLNGKVGKVYGQKNKERRENSYVGGGP